VRQERRAQASRASPAAAAGALKEDFMNKSILAGAVLATAVGLMFTGAPAMAQSGGATAQKAGVKCLGGNDCSGKSACKTATSPGPGQNSCKGQGYVMTSTAKECTDKGGKPATPTAM
jgi:hypothetical protein